MVGQSEFSRIQSCVSAGDFAGAEAVCAAIADQETNNPGFWLMRGDVALMAARADDAEAHYRWVATLAPDAAKAWLGVARACIAGGRAAAAGVAVERAMSLGLDDALVGPAIEIFAHAKFAAGDLAAGRNALAALVPAHREQLLHAKKPSEEALRAALPPALCAGDTALVHTIMRALYPQAAPLGPIAIAPTATLQAWCEAAGVPCTVIDPPRKITTEPTTPYSRRDTYKTAALLFASIPNGQWVAGWDFALGSDGTVLVDTGYLEIKHVFNHAPHAYFRDAKLVAHAAPAREEYIDDDVLYLSGPMHQHFGYWLNDFAPRLLGRKHAGKRMRIAVPADLTGAKFMDVFALAGITEDDIVRCDPHTRYRFRTLHVYRGSVRPHPDHLGFLRDALHDPAGPVHPRKGKRFFLSRAGIGTRVPSNTAEFERCLAENGVITVDLAALSIAEQRALFADAEVLLCGLGSDVFAMYFAPPGCAVIVMQWNDGFDIDPYGPAMCQMVGMRHQFLLCPNTQPSKNARHWLDLDFAVDCAALTQRLRECDAANTWE